MSTIAPPAVTPNASSPQSAADQLIDQRIEEARRALWWSELTRIGLTVVIGSMLALLTWLLVDHWIYSPGRFVRVICFVGLVAAGLWYLIRRAWPVMTSRVTSEYAAWALEKDHPDYRQQLTSYVTLKQESPERGIRARVVRVIGARAAILLKSNDRLPDEATGTFRWWITAAAVFAILAAYCVASPKSSLASIKRLAAPIASIEPVRRVQIRDVLPGDTQSLAGRDVEVSAQINGLRANEPVYCRWSSDGPMRQTELALDPSSDRFVGAIPLDHSASGLIRYRIEAGDAIAGPFDLDVENVPVVAIESIRHEPPPYTNRKPHTTSSPAISAIDGTQIRISAKTNRPVTKAELQFNAKTVGDSVRVTGGRKPITIAADGMTLTADVTLRSARGNTAAVETENYRIRVWDSHEQSNPDPIIYPIKVIPDLSPEVAIVVPTKSPVEVPVGGQQIIEVHAMDADFELESVTLEIERGIDTLGRPTIWEKPDGKSGKGNQVAEYRFRPAEHRLRAGDVVRITATAIDNRSIPGDPTVKPNESTTDPVEIRIVEDSEELPADPTGNDGLSRPDDRPASDVDKSEQNESGGQNAGGQGSGEQGSEGQQSEGQTGGGENSGQQNTGDQNTEGQNSAGQSGSEGEPTEATGNENTGGENTGDQSGGDASAGQDRMGQSDSEQTDSGESGDDQTGQPQGGSSDTGQDGGESSKSPPKHDGEAIERIKDYIEKQKQRQNQREGASGNNEQSQGEPQDSTGAPNDPSKTGEQQSGEQQSGEQPSGEQQSGEQQSGEQPSGEQPSGEQPSGEQPSGEQPSGEQPSGEQPSGEPKNGESSSQGESQGGADTAGQNAPSGSQPQGQSPSSESSSGGQNSGSGMPSEGDDSGAEPPPPPDLEYAKQATDMVLDYLDETRDQVDENLLKELDWTEQDLQRFRERWEKVRQLDQPTPDAKPNTELEDALRSLGLQQNTTPSQRAGNSGDTIRDLRDSGNRRKAPPALRDAFDAFRRRK